MRFILTFAILLVSSAVSNGADFGQVGQIYDIVERDMMEVIKERASKVDWGAMVDKSKKEITENIGKVDKPLPKALDNSTYYIDLTTILDHDINIRDKSGKPKVLYPKGFKFNPLDYTSSTSKFVIFDATRKEEVEWYKSKYANIANAMPIITKGSAYNFAKDMHREVYVIDDAILKTFKLKATPTVVYQEKNKLRADEYRIEGEQVPPLTLPKTELTPMKRGSSALGKEIK